MTTKQFPILRPLKIEIWNNRMDDGKRQRIKDLRSVRIRLKLYKYSRERKMFLLDLWPIMNRGRDIDNSGRVYYQVEKCINILSARIGHDYLNSRADILDVMGFDHMKSRKCITIRRTYNVGKLLQGHTVG